MCTRSENMCRRIVAAGIVWAAVLPLLGPIVLKAAEPNYPAKPVRIVCPAVAGSSADVRTRLLAERLSARLGQRFVVENKPGAGATLGTVLVADAKPDGYTLLATFTPNFPIGPVLYRAARYDPVTSFTPIAMFSRASPFLIVHPSFPGRTLEEFVALAKSKPGALIVAHSGLAGPAHLPAELFRRAAGIDVLYVPYKSEALALPDLIGGQISAMFAYTAMAVPQIKAGNVRALAVAGAHRNGAVPNVPTFAESGYPAVEFHGTMLLLGPAGLRKELVTLLNSEVASILIEPNVRASYESTGAEPVSGSPEQVAELIKRELSTNGVLVKELAISLE